MPRRDIEQRRHKQDAAIAVLNVGPMDDRMEQQTQRIEEKVPFFVLDLLAPALSRSVRVVSRL